MNFSFIFNIILRASEWALVTRNIFSQEVVYAIFREIMKFLLYIRLNLSFIQLICLNTDTCNHIEKENSSPKLYLEIAKILHIYSFLQEKDPQCFQPFLIISRIQIFYPS
jgi:hypothetical protein